MASEEQKNVRFLSKFHSLKIVRKPIRTREVEGQIVQTDGESIRFSEGAFETSDPEVVDFLMNRPEFESGIIIRVPDNVKNLVAHQAEWEKDLEQREADLARREAALAAKESKVSGDEEGARVGNPGAADDLDDLKRPELVQIANELGIPSDQTKVGTTNDAIVQLIRSKRAELAAKSGGENGDAAAY